MQPTASTDTNCADGVTQAVANAYRGVALAVFGTGARDKMLLAEMSVTASITDITQAENKTKLELSSLVDAVKTTHGSRNKSAMNELLSRSRVLRGILSSMAKKRMGMEKQLETLRQSQLNQNMLVSMKHTSEALQTIGMKISDADNIMMDLEDTNTDINNLQNTLSANFMETELDDDDLTEELERILSDDSMGVSVRQKHGKAKNNPEPDKSSMLSVHKLSVEAPTGQEFSEVALVADDVDGGMTKEKESTVQESAPALDNSIT